MGNCKIHNIPMETDIDECGRCEGWGFEDDELDGRMRCFRCLGKGEIEVTWCEICEDQSYDRFEPGVCP